MCIRDRVRGGRQPPPEREGRALLEACLKSSKGAESAACAVEPSAQQHCRQVASVSSRFGHFRAASC
eukprot:7699290-Alexandrium_andersonii.AAC.1